MSGDVPVTWEACHTMSGAWGYSRDEHTWKSAEQLIKLLIESVSSNGNLIMNVGPTARGTFDDRATLALTTYGRWMSLNDRSIYGCSASPADFPPAPSGTRFTFSPIKNRLFVHLFDWPIEHLHLPDLAGRIEYAQFLHDASEVSMKVHGSGENLHEALAAKNAAGTLTLTLPVRKPDVVVPVIELFLR